MRPPAVFLEPSETDAIVEVVAAAFHEYAVMRFAHDPGDDYADRVKALFRFSCRSRFAYGRPVLGVRDGGRIVGVALAHWPVADPVAPDLETEREAMWRAIGAAAGERMKRYTAAADGLAPKCPHYHLGVLAVAPDAQGRGWGRVLLDALHALSASDPASTGVSLNTESEKNVALYRHVGYRVVGEADLADGAPVAPGSADRRQLHTWCLYRPDDPA